MVPLVIDRKIEYGLQQPGLDGAEGAGEVDEHDTDSAIGSVLSILYL